MTRGEGGWDGNKRRGRDERHWSDINYLCSLITGHMHLIWEAVYWLSTSSSPPLNDKERVDVEEGQQVGNILQLKLDHKSIMSPFIINDGKSSFPILLRVIE